MAYKKSIVYNCDYSNCRRNARFEVFNTYNSPDGYYCRQHANVRVVELNIKEINDGEKEEA